MAEKKAEVPADRCGFELQFENVRLQSKKWEVTASAVCCWRPVWKNHEETERCIWHADVDEKPIDEMLASRADIPEKLDGAILKNIDVNDRLSFSECGLIGARFDDTNLQNVDFTDADIMSVTFSNTDLRSAMFSGADLHRAHFSDTNLQWADFIDAELAGAEFPDAELMRTDFTDAYLQFADLPNAYARHASFRHANLQDAVFTRTDCREATFTSALLYDTVFDNTRINSRTTFFDPETTFYDSITSRPGCVYEENSLTTNHPAEERFPTNHLPEEVQPLEAARWVYRRLETLHEENALSEAAREFHISKEEAERALYRERGEYGPWGVKTLMWYLTRHGESVKHVLYWWGGVIFTAGLLFAGLDGVKDATGTTYAITSLGELRAVAGWQDLLLNIYFSITTFSTIMDGGLAPAGNRTRAVVAIESITGALLVALLVFVLGRRVAR